MATLIILILMGDWSTSFWSSTQHKIRRMTRPPMLFFWVFTLRLLSPCWQKTTYGRPL